MEENEVITKAGELFIRYGIKSMTMDDVSRQLGMSKKTLYQYCENKKDLVKKVMKQQIEKEQNCICDLFHTEKNAIDKLMDLTKFVGAQMKDLHPSVMFDLKKYHLEAWSIWNKHKVEFIYKNIKANIETGIKEGLYRDNMNAEIVAHFYLAMINTIIDPDYFSDETYSRLEIHTEMMRYHIRGIASSTGRNYLKEKFSQDNV